MTLFKNVPLLVSDWFPGLFVHPDDEERQKEVVKELGQPHAGEANSADVVLNVENVGIALCGSN